MLVPARCHHAGAVAAGKAQPAVAPGRPGSSHLFLRQALEQLVVAFRAWQARQGRHVPSAADYGDPFAATFLGGADRVAHGSLAPQFRQVRCAANFLAHHRHHLGDRRKEVEAVAALLDQVVPPGLGIAVARRLGQPGQRVGTYGGRRAGICSVTVRVLSRFLRLGQPVALRQVTKTYRYRVRIRIPDRLPLGRIVGERIKHGALRVRRRIHEQGAGRHQPRLADPGQQAVGVRRALDQDAIGPQRLQCLGQAARATGPVVANAEQVNAHREKSLNASRRGRRGTGLSSLRAPSPPSPGTRA